HRTRPSVLPLPAVARELQRRRQSGSQGGVHRPARRLPGGDHDRMPGVSYRVRAETGRQVGPDPLVVTQVREEQHAGH
ncbi:MAG TPA: hypothetical protein VKH61_02990, partial [Streptosporangiaceae bacterium]|nr:hypothetical protein [Streptosporangiaceae bacterium]